MGPALYRCGLRNMFFPKIQPNAITGSATERISLQRRKGLSRVKYCRSMRLASVLAVRMRGTINISGHRPHERHPEVAGHRKLEYAPAASREEHYACGAAGPNLFFPGKCSPNPPASATSRAEPGRAIEQKWRKPVLGRRTPALGRASEAEK